MLTLKQYQQQALDILRTYFRECANTGDADVSFYKITRENFGAGVNYRPVQELPGLPYVCLRIPTGGGKTFVACHAVALAAKELLHADRCLTLWLVPSNAIRDQTVKALKNRRHPYRQALEAAFGSVAILETREALYVQRAALDNETVIIVSTLQAFRVDDTEGRKVYEPSGSLMSHFSNLPAEIARTLEHREDGSIATSLANVLRLQRPIVIVDEAHNARTKLSFETLARFNPSCIIEFTATPDTEDNPSNVLHSASAAELQAENMIKMPIRLETRPHWKEVLADAVAMLSRLEMTAKTERQANGEYLRPIMLLQAQPRRKDQPTLTFEVVKECLLNDHRIPVEQIAIATGTEWELDDVDLPSPTCPIRFVITVHALREGWDCPFAYVLCSVAELKSSTAVEQILGRVMRLPNAKRKTHDELNMAYAFVASQRFADAANALTDALVENGFNRQEAREFITRADALVENLPLFQSQTLTIVVAEPPDLTKLPKDVEVKITFDEQAGVLNFTGVMSERDREMLACCFTTYSARAEIERAYRQSQGMTIADPRELAERVERFAIPLLAIKHGDLFEQFEETHFLEHQWHLSVQESSLSETDFPSERQAGQQGEIVINQQGQIAARFITDLQQQMTLIADDRWNVGQLLNWLERTIPHADLEPDEIARFLQKMLRHLLDERGLRLDYLVHNKYRLRQAAEKKIEHHRLRMRQQAYQALLLPDCPTPLVVKPELYFAFSSSPHVYPYNTLYRGTFEFQKHYYKVVGDLKPQGDEFECTQFIDALPEVKFWIRNLAGKPEHAFWLQTSTDRFYPDFVCLLNDGRYLVVEYKNEKDWSNDDSKEKRDLGELWEARSGGRCLFIMPKGKDFTAIRAKIKQK